MIFEYTYSVSKSELSERLSHWSDLCDKDKDQKVTGYYKGPFTLIPQAEDGHSYVQFDVSGQSPKLHLRYDLCLSAFQKILEFMKAEEKQKLTEILNHHQKICSKTSKLLERYGQ